MLAADRFMPSETSVSRFFEVTLGWISIKTTVSGKQPRPIRKRSQRLALPFRIATLVAG